MKKAVYGDELENFEKQNMRIFMQVFILQLPSSS